MRISRLALLHDEMRFIGGGERVLLRVAALARPLACPDLALLWSDGTLAADAALLGDFDDVATLAFPDGLQVGHAVALAASMGRLRRWLRTRAPHAAVAFGLRTALHVAPLARQLGVPLAWMCQEGFPLFAGRRHAGVKRRVAAKLLTWARTHVVCPSDDSRRGMQRMGIPDERVHLIRNGIDYGWFADAAMAEDAALAWRAAHAIPAGDLVAVCVARLDPLKGHPVLLRALHIAAAAGLRVVLVCVGQADAGDAYAGELRAAATRLGVDDRVVWAGYHADVRPWLAMADVAVLSSTRECASLALVEAGACGLPLVASRVGGNPEIARHGETGILFDPGDAAACAAAFGALAREPAQRREMGRRAQALVRSEFNAAVWDRRWLEFLQALLGAGRP